MFPCYWIIVIVTASTMRENWVGIIDSIRGSWHKSTLLDYAWIVWTVPITSGNFITLNGKERRQFMSGIDELSGCEKCGMMGSASFQWIYICISRKSDCSQGKEHAGICLLLYWSGFQQKEREEYCQWKSSRKSCGGTGITLGMGSQAKPECLRSGRACRDVATCQRPFAGPWTAR